MKKELRQNKKLILTIGALILLLVTINSASADVDLTNNLFSFWDGSYSGSTAYDAHDDNEGTASNTRVFGTDGVLSKGFDFSKGDDRINFNSVEPSGSFSISGWFKTSATTNFMGVVDKITMNTDPKGYLIHVNPTSSNNPKLQFRTAWGGNTNNFLDVTSTSNVNTGSWVHFVATYDGSTMRLYVNGVLESSGSQSNGVSHSTQDFFLGGDGGSTNYFNGLIDEVGVWDRALNIDEVRALCKWDSEEEECTGALPYSDFEEEDEPPAPDAPEVSTLVMTTATSYTGFRAYGQVTDFGSETSVEAFFQYRVQGAGTWSETSKTTVTTSTSSSFDLAITGLSHNTTYEYRAALEYGSPAAYVYGTTRTSTTMAYPVARVKDGSTDTFLDDFCVSIDDGNYISGIDPVGTDETFCTSDGEGYVLLEVYYGSGEYDVLIEVDDYFNTTQEEYTIAHGNTYTFTVYANEVKFRGYDLTTAEIPINITIGGVKKASNESFLLTNDEHTALIESSGYFPMNYSFNLTGRENKTINVTGLYDSLLTIKPRDIINNNTINNTNITISSNNFFLELNEEGVTNATFQLLSGSYELTINAENRSEYKQNITVTSGTKDFYAYMYAYNSIWVYAFRQTDSVSISNFNVTVANTTNEYYANGTGGVARISLIPSGVYEVRVSASGYVVASYVITVTDNSAQTINAYLTSDANTFTFTVKNKNTGNIIEGATITQRRFIGGVLTTVASKQTDIIGKAHFSYEEGVEYSFLVNKNNFINRNFNLIIIYDDYTILLTPDSSHNEAVYIDDVSINPKGFSFVGDGNNSYYALEFVSTGQLESYYINITYSGGSNYVEGTNTNGEIINNSLILVGINNYDEVTVKYGYKSTVNAAYKHYTAKHRITDVPSRRTSLGGAKNYFNGLGAMERVFGGTILVMIITSIIGLAGVYAGTGLLAGGALGGFLGMALAYYLGFFTLPTVIITMFVFALIIGTRAGGGT
jgi:hypothetical protein